MVSPAPEPYFIRSRGRDVELIDQFSLSSSALDPMKVTVAGVTFLDVLEDPRGVGLNGFSLDIVSLGLNTCGE